MLPAETVALSGQVRAHLSSRTIAVWCAKRPYFVVDFVLCYVFESYSRVRVQI